MTREEFANTNEISSFCKECLGNELQGKAIYQQLWKEAKNVEDFKVLVRHSFEVKFFQGTAVLLDGDKDYLSSILGDKCFRTTSDAGGVKIGNENFSIVIPNNLGDGLTRIAILNEKENNSSAFNFMGAIQGRFNIYNYDCGDKVIKTLQGRYLVYSKNGFVVLERCE